jgi:hypothetical protein
MSIVIVPGAQKKSAGKITPTGNNVFIDYRRVALVDPAANSHNTPLARANRSTSQLKAKILLEANAVQEACGAECCPEG